MRILIIGNIANNGFLIAKFLREQGIEVDVLCYDYYDIMSCPEWEDAEFDDGWGRNERPEWFNVNLHGYVRPGWFAQGPMVDAVNHLISPNSKTLRKLSIINQTANYTLDQTSTWTLLSDCLIYSHAWTNWHPNEWPDAFRKSPTRFLVFLPIRILRCFQRAAQRISARFKPDNKEKEKLITFPRTFSSTFGRQFNYLPQMAEFMLSRKVSWEQLFSKYDIVQGHATDGIFPLFFGKHPYVAFEHGTIRNIPFQDDFVGQACALTYKMADKVLITNCDNIAAAKKLDLKNYIFLPHPINEIGSTGDDNAIKSLRDELRRDLNSEYIVLHPSRQHWDPKVRHPSWEKGNDIFIRGFADFAKISKLRPAIVLAEWGLKIEETKRLLSELGITNRVKWIKPMPHRRMVKFIRACDIVADQFWLGAFGGITPKAMMCGRAALLHFNEDTHKWVFPELPPVLNANTPESISAILQRHSTDQSFRSNIESRSHEWYLKYHSSSVITDRLTGIYQDLLNKHSRKGDGK